MQKTPKASPVEDYGRVGDVVLSDVPGLADCRPGLEPTEYNVVVIAAVMPEKVGSILIADETRERMGDGLQVGRVIAVSPIAFNYERWPEGASPPGVGDIVWFARYAGGTFTGVDGRQYRLVKDKDIGAIIPVTHGSDGAEG